MPGRVEVGEQQARLEVSLPWWLQKIARAAQRTVEGRVRILRGKK
jgi:hypothetical protein